ncbi:hypothetical protein [Acetobacter oeni]|uniref:Uncharacterized protein n=1 Tax=Acetobacter oeni TaxID=304077 RepID=A0A511XNH0_9PROT|nr:hypothetical protein [Acetobacter oeni]MBB3884330.1 molybdenum cofactor biosynthesis enzyme [Acetobacter oeni]NHO20315.1 hypothetical protein [Acetobacter oeni]GBR05228.1 hypothetical protein AA21952_1665 [Acetobacter oeni LMG 21952]GEN64492.1 hypothetical protein AOE01nite_27160 [Acetobacter oeni]
MVRHVPILTHLAESGKVPRMVDVGSKAVTNREAHARARLQVRRKAQSVVEVI